MRGFWIFITVLITLLAITIGALYFAVTNTAKLIDERGGLKAVVERVWEGKP